MRSERVLWLFVVLVEVVLLAGALSVAFLPDQVQPFGRAVTIGLAVIVAVFGFVLISRPEEADQRRYIWSRTRWLPAAGACREERIRGSTCLVPGPST